MGSFGQALFWTQAMAGIWMVSAVATHGDEIYAYMRDWMFGAPVKVAVAAIGPLDRTCPSPQVPTRNDHNTLVLDDFRIEADGTLPPEQYLTAEGEPYEIIQITGQGADNNFAPGTYYCLPPTVVFLPNLLNAKTDSAPYVGEALYTALDRLACFASPMQGQVRINKALLSVPRQKYWETDRTILAYGLGTTGVHMQIVDTASEKRTPWENDQVMQAAQLARLTVPSPEIYRAYVKLNTGR